MWRSTRRTKALWYGLKLTNLLVPRFKNMGEWKHLGIAKKNDRRTKPSTRCLGVVVLV